MKLIQTEIPEVVIIEPIVYEDERGWFMESFNEGRFNEELKKLGLPLPPPMSRRRIGTQLHTMPQRSSSNGT